MNGRDGARRGVRRAQGPSVALALMCAALGVPLGAQARPSAAPRPDAPSSAAPAVRALSRGAPLARVDSLLAVGRLAAAEQLLYAAVAERPRAPEARGALAWYLATRARFIIAGVLFDEALRFGADPRAVATARAAIAPWQATHAGPAASLPFAFAEDGRHVGFFALRAADGSAVRAALDPNALGATTGSAATARVLADGAFAGERRIPLGRIAVDPALAPGEVRLGLDLLWGHAPVFDERRALLLLGGATSEARAGARVGPPPGSDERLVPFVLGLPGLWLVEAPGLPPTAVESPRGRVLLRGSVWRVDAGQSVVVVERSAR